MWRQRLPKGGTLTIAMDAKGNQFGICNFADGSSCEEWLFFKGQCSAPSKYLKSAESVCPLGGGRWGDYGPWGADCYCDMPDTTSNGRVFGCPDQFFCEHEYNGTEANYGVCRRIPEPKR